MGLFKKQQKRQRRTLTVQKPARQYNDYYRSNSHDSTQQVRLENAPPTKLRRTNAKAHFKRLPMYIAIVIMILSLIYSSIISNNVLVMVPDGQGLHTKEFYEEKASTILKNSFTNKSKFTFDSQRFKAELQSQIPEIKTVNLSLPLAGKRPVVGLTFVRPLYEFRVNGGTYIVGEDGVIIADASMIITSKKDTLRKVQDDAPLTAGVGRAVLLASDVEFLEAMYKELDAAKIDVSLATLPLGAGELYVKPTGENYVIKFSLSGDARQQVGAYLALLQSGNLTTSPTEYIDVRLGERVFVK